MENWSDSVDTLRSLASLILSWNEKEKQPRSFLHRNIPWITNHDQAAVENLEHTLAKLRHTGVRIGQKCPKIEINWQVDPRFASKTNLSGKKSKNISEHSYGAAYHPYAGNNCTIRIIYHSLKKRGQRKFLSNWCINEMPYPYRIRRAQVSSVISPRYDFPAKHISRRMLHSASFPFLWSKTDWIQWIPSIHLLLSFYAETRKKNSLDHFCIKIFLELLITNKPQHRSWKIP